MNRSVFVISLLAATGVCLAAGPPEPEAVALRQEVLNWMGAVQDFEFTGTVEFFKTLKLPPDRSKLEQVDLVFPPDKILHTGLPELDALNATRARRRQELVDAALEGDEIVQAWRIDTAQENKIRVEHSTRSARLLEEDYYPFVTVAVRDGARAWQWRGPVGRAADLPRRDPSASSMTRPRWSLLDQAAREVGAVFDAHPAWLRMLKEAALVSVRQGDNVVVAKLVAEKDASGEPAWTSRLEFARSPHGLLLARRTTATPTRYWITKLSDYREAAGRMVAWRRTVRYGLLEEFSLQEGSLVDDYRIISIREDITALDLGRFRKPAKGVSYEDVTGPGRTPFTP